MCKALDDLYADGVEEGREKGLEEEYSLIERIYKVVSEEPGADRERIFE